jgi:hypothetical protein
MLEPIIFKQRIELFSDLQKSNQLPPELRLIIDNHATYYEKHKTAAEGSRSQAYYALRLTELENWVTDEAGYIGLSNAIEKVRNRNLIFGTEKDVLGLKNLLNYIGILCEHMKIQASENLYAMLALIDLIVNEELNVEQSEFKLNEFKRFFVEDDPHLQPINDLAVPRNITHPKTFALKSYSALVDLANGKLADIYVVYAKEWGDDYFKSKDSPKQHERRSISLTFSGLLSPEWIKTLSTSMRRSSRVSSTSSNALSSSSSNLSISSMK